MSSDDNEMSDELRQRLIATVPHFSAIEASKENVLPSRHGREAAQLQAVLRTDDPAHWDNLKEGHQYYERELARVDEVDDPLDIYIRYIRWTEQMYPQGHNPECDLTGLLEDATTRFQNCVQYKEDARYLRCWLQYALHVPDPGEIFKVLERKNIGQCLALYYEEYATYFERQQRFDKAEEIYTLGIKRNAVPTARLQRRYEQFKTQRRHANAAPHPGVTQQQILESTGRRTMLGHKFDSTSALSVPANVYHRMNPSSASAPRSFGNAGLASSMSSSSVSSSSSSRISVFTGPEITSPPSPSSSSSSSTSPAILTVPSQRDENRTPKSKFAGTTLPQKPYSRPSGPAFTVFKDTDGADPAHDPKNWKSLDARFFALEPNIIRSTDTKGRSEYIHATRDCLGRNGVFVSFEELRLAQSMPKMSFSEVIEASEKPPEQELTNELTAETRGAIASINALMYKKRTLTDPGEGLSFSAAKRRIVDENAMEEGSFQEQDFTRSGDMDLFGRPQPESDTDDDQAAMDEDLYRESAEAEGKI
ncbi:Mad3/BUB1 homology region 1-domain-containing protein [Syncephalastrum racemosum]|uniref:Mad3/BUB1 homology region 1-domain-containing protein n=1 Tax=Syncephalastrum racemosum TaxID=13706 RepID=A0A1X2HG41_SYNRA|nr:Mad3/BUB1 homology region 1-domain-containing protein [Syncephalastrum racemosum]